MLKFSQVNEYHTKMNVSKVRAFGILGGPIRSNQQPERLIIYSSLVVGFAIQTGMLKMDNCDCL